MLDLLFETKKKMIFNNQNDTFTHLYMYSVLTMMPCYDNNLNVNINMYN